MSEWNLVWMYDWIRKIFPPPPKWHVMNLGRFYIQMLNDYFDEMFPGGEGEWCRGGEDELYKKSWGGILYQLTWKKHIWTEVGGGGQLWDQGGGTVTLSYTPSFRPGATAGAGARTLCCYVVLVINAVNLLQTNICYKILFHQFIREKVTNRRRSCETTTNVSRWHLWAIVHGIGKW